MKKTNFHAVLKKLKKEGFGDQREQKKYDLAIKMGSFQFLGNLYDEIFGTETDQKGWEVKNIEQHKQKFYNLMNLKFEPEEKE